MFKTCAEFWVRIAKALLICVVFHGQTTNQFLDALKESNAIATIVPLNMTHLFQSLDFRVNKLAKDFIKQSFSKWFSRKVNIDLEIGHELDDVVVDYQLSVLKPLHKKWLISIYNHMSSSEGKEIILSD